MRNSSLLCSPELWNEQVFSVSDWVEFVHPKESLFDTLQTLNHVGPRYPLHLLPATAPPHHRIWSLNVCFVLLGLQWYLLNWCCGENLVCEPLWKVVAVDDPWNCTHPSPRLKSRCLCTITLYLFYVSNLLVEVTLIPGPPFTFFPLYVFMCVYRGLNLNPVKDFNRRLQPGIAFSRFHCTDPSSGVVVLLCLLLGWF